MNKFGIAVNYSPVLSMRNQGLTRLLAELISHMKDQEEIYLLIPEWSVADFKLLLKEHGYCSNNIKFVTLKSNYLLKFISIIFKDNKTRNSDLKISCTTPTSKNFFSYFLKHSVINLLKLASMPFIFALKGLKKCLKNQQFITTHNTYNSSKLRSILKKLTKNHINIPKLLLRKYALKMTSRYMMNLVAYGNKLTQIDAWLIPSPVFPEATFLTKPFLLVIPDLVYIDFPFQFASEAFFKIDSIIKNLSKHSAAIVTYSSHVAENHAFNYLNYKSKHIYKIFNAGISSTKHLCSDSIESLNFYNLKQIAWQKIVTYLANNYKKNQWQSFIKHTKNKKIVFASTQYRPHKNLINLFRAVNILNKQESDQYVIVLTADIFNNNFLKSYILSNNMESFIYSFFNIPAEILASLNCVSDVSIFPTLSEGGFPFFSFYEAYTVGTPCLLSITPVSQEIKFSDQTTFRTYFKPLDIHEIAEKIRWSTNNKRKLYQIQSEIYRKLAERTWDEVAREYINALESIKV